MERQDEAQASAPLVMLPGLICDGRTFDDQARAFSGSIAFPGYRDADTLAAMAACVLQAVPGRMALLGHSMGARVALEVVRQTPERVERLALVDTGIHPVGAGEAEKRHALRDLGRAQGMAALVDAWLPPMVAPANRTPALMARLRAMCCDAGLETFERHIHALLTRPALDALLPTITCPVLVAVGSEDIWSPPAQHAVIAAAIPGSRLVVIEGAGHMLPAERGAALNAAIGDWLAMPARHSDPRHAA